MCVHEQTELSGRGTVLAHIGIGFLLNAVARFRKEFPKK